MLQYNIQRKSVYATADELSADLGRFTLESVVSHGGEMVRLEEYCGSWHYQTFRATNYETGAQAEFHIDTEYHYGYKVVRWYTSADSTMKTYREDTNE